MSKSMPLPGEADPSRPGPARWLAALATAISLLAAVAAGWALLKPAPVPEPVGRRPVFDGRSGKTADVPVYRREKLPPGSIFNGPAIVAEDETSTYVSASFAAHIDASGCIVMDRKAA